MAKKKIEPVIEEVEEIQENITVQPLDTVMGDRYANYAKYVIQDRAIPDVRDGMKPVQRRIIYTMYKSGNTYSKPTKKCAHTVGAVMGTYHPHGDTSIYEALARMSQDWKVRYPLIDFQGNNGSIDGDSPAAYRYTEARLSQLSNELVRGIDKNSVDMQLNFDDTELEPTVLPARFPNLLVNGSEGIAVALATEIPPHNLKEVIDATIYRIGHKSATVEDLRQFVLGPDFPTGGVIYKSSGLDQIYETGRGRIEIAAKAEIVQQKNIQQIVITEVPYKCVKIQLVYEIDKIRHSKSIDGIIEVRDESDWNGVRIVVDLKKDVKADLVLAYLMKKTSLQTSYSANMVAIVNGRPKTLNLLDFVDAYIAHQVEVLTRESEYDLAKFKSRLSIVDGLIIASLNINDVVDIIKKSNDKNDSKANLIAKYNLTNEQAEAIVMMPLYKLSHTDELTLEAEKKELEGNIANLEEILSNPEKLNKVLIKDLKNIAKQYGDERRTQILEKEGEVVINKIDLIAEESTMLAITRDGYAKRCSLKSYKSSGDSLPGLKAGDRLVGKGEALTTDYLISFTNYGNYVCLPVYILTETKWKDEGSHLNSFVTFASGEKIVKCLIVREFRDDIYLGLVSKFGQIKRTPLSLLDRERHSRPSKCMKLLSGDEIAGIAILSGDSDVLVLTTNGNCSLYNENDISITGPKSSGVKSISALKGSQVATLLAFDENERGKVILITDKGCQRILNIDKITKTQRLGKPQVAFSCFKNDVHKLVGAKKVPYRVESVSVDLDLSNDTVFNLKVDDFNVTDSLNAKKNISIPAKVTVRAILSDSIEIISKDTVSHPIKVKEEKPAPVSVESVQGDIFEEDNVEEVVEELPVEETPVEVEEPVVEEAAPVSEEAPVIEPVEAPVEEKKKPSKKKDDAKNVEQISIFDDFDED